MSESKQPEKMTVSDALEIVRDSMGLWCAEYDEETGEQCQGVPVWTLRNLKRDTSSHRCEEHKPKRAHYADFVDPFRGAVAFDMIATTLATAERERDEARAELAKERADLAALTARMEVEIAAAAEAVRARAIAECAAKASKIAAVRQTVASQRLSGIDARHHWDDDPELAAAAHEMADRLDALEESERAAPTEPADVDPAAGALR